MKKSVNIKKAARICMATHDMTASDLAIKIGLTKSYMSELLSGKKNIKIDHVESMAKAFNMKLSDFIALGEGDDQSKKSSG